MAKKPDPKGWELFEACFKEGDEVGVIDTDDRFHWGKAAFNEQGFALYRPGGKAVAFHWDDVRFIGHDGFPVRKLLGADGSSTIERLDTTDTQAAVRTALTMEYNACAAPRLRFGDPYDIEDVVARLYHPGNSGLSYWNRFYDFALRRYPSDAHRDAGWEREEVIVMESRDGAKAELWDLPTVYMFEG